MAVKTLYPLGTTAATPNWWGNMQDGGSVPGASSSGFGWAPAKQSSTTLGFYRAFLGATATSGTAALASTIDSTSGPRKGTGSGAATAGDSFVAGPYYGNFANTAWTFHWNMRAGVAGCVGQIRMRVWRSSSADGTTTPIELTAGAQSGGIITLSTTADLDSSISWSPGIISLVGEYLFFQLEWKETTTGTSNTDTVLFRIGLGSNSVTSSVVTPDFTFTYDHRFWYPSNYASGVLGNWHDASNSANITQIAGAISADADLSGGSHTDTQSGSGKPTVSAAAINSLDTESFASASSQYFVNNVDYSAKTDIGEIWIIKNTATTTTKTMVGAVANGGFQFRFDNAKLQTLLQNSAGISNGTVLVPVSAVSILAVKWSNTGSGPYQFRINGSDAGTGTVGGVVTITSTTGNVGANNGTTEFFDGLIGERISVNSSTLSDIQLAEGYLAWRWDQVSSLDAAHPYKVVPPPAPPFLFPRRRQYLRR